MLDLCLPKTEFEMHAASSKGDYIHLLTILIRTRTKEKSKMCFAIKLPSLRQHIKILPVLPWDNGPISLLSTHERREPSLAKVSPKFDTESDKKPNPPRQKAYA